METIIITGLRDLRAVWSALIAGEQLSVEIWSLCHNSSDLIVDTELTSLRGLRVDVGIFSFLVLSCYLNVKTNISST